MYRLAKVADLYEFSDFDDFARDSCREGMPSTILFARLPPWLVRFMATAAWGEPFAVRGVHASHAPVMRLCRRVRSRLERG